VTGIKSESLTTFIGIGTLDIKDALQAMTETVLSRTRLLQAIDEFGLYAKKRDLCLPKTSFALNQLKLTSSGC